jgi:hypothetical protein
MAIVIFLLFEPSSFQATAAANRHSSRAQPQRTRYDIIFNRNRDQLFPASYAVGCQEKDSV